MRYDEINLPTLTNHRPKHMKKILIATVLIVPFMWIGSTWFISNKTEQMFEQILAESNQKFASSLPFIKIKKQSFEKGFRTSTAKSIVFLDTEKINTEPLSLPLIHTFFHGPLMFTPNGVKTGSSYILTTLNQELLDPEVKEIVSQFFDDKEPITLGLKTGVGSNIEIDLKVSPLLIDSEMMDSKVKISDKSKTKLTMDAISSKLSIDSEGNYLEGTMHFGALKMEHKEYDEVSIIAMDAAVIEMDIAEMYKGAILDGWFKMDIPKLYYSNNKGAEQSIKELTLMSSAATHKGSFGGTTELNINKLDVATLVKPFELPECTLHMSFGLKGLTRDSVIKLIDSSEEMRKIQMSLMGGNNAKQSMDTMNNALNSYVKALGNTIEQGVETNNIIEITNDTGKSVIKFDLIYADSTKLFDLKTIKDLIVALKGQLKINVNKSIIAGTPVQVNINQLLTSNFVVDKGEAYEMLIDLSAGELIVNGNPIPIFDMLGATAEQPLPWQTM